MITRYRKFQIMGTMQTENVDFSFNSYVYPDGNPQEIHLGVARVEENIYRGDPIIFLYYQDGNFTGPVYEKPVEDYIKQLAEEIRPELENLLRQTVQQITRGAN